MKVTFTALEARVIGCLMEKEVTTPEAYPLSLNALVLACNQKSNRDPVLALDEATVQSVVDGLMKQHLVSDRAGYGGRVPKYKQVFCNTTMGPLQFADLERAILCELLLRGPQSAGELRTRCNRMTPVADTGQVEAALSALMAHEAGPFVARLPRQPGTRDARYGHLLGGEVAAAVPEDAVPASKPPERRAPAVADAGDQRRLEDLEVKCAFLESANQELSDVVARQQQQLDQALKQVEDLRRQVEALELAYEQGSPPADPRADVPPHY